jgi:hypothetical protein
LRLHADVALGDGDGFMPPAHVRLGLREKLAQFSLLVVVNAFVGAMVVGGRLSVLSVGVYGL